MNLWQAFELGVAVGALLTVGLVALTVWIDSKRKPKLTDDEQARARGDHWG